MTICAVPAIREDLYQHVHALVESGAIKECVLVLDMATGHAAYMINGESMSEERAAERYLVPPIRQ